MTRPFLIQALQSADVLAFTEQLVRYREEPKNQRAKNHELSESGNGKRAAGVCAEPRRAPSIERLILEFLFERKTPSQASRKPKPESGQTESPVRKNDNRAFATDGKASEKGSAKLEGTWEVIEGTDNGEPVPPEKIKGFRFVFHEGTLEWIGPDGKKEDEFRVRLGGQQAPSAIDLLQMPSSALKKEQTTALVHELQEETTPAIYELKGDALRMCLPQRGAWQRPNSFMAEKGSRETSFTLKRVKE